MAAKTIFLVRHGESEANVGDYYKGEGAPLTRKGKKQAEFIAERVSRLPVDVLISSTMERAKETASFISRKIDKSIEYTDLVVERRYPTALIGLKRHSKKGDTMWNDWTKSCAGSRATGESR